MQQVHVPLWVFAILSSALLMQGRASAQDSACDQLGVDCHPPICGKAGGCDSSNDRSDSSQTYAIDEAWKAYYKGNEEKRAGNYKNAVASYQRAMRLSRFTIWQGSAHKLRTAIKPNLEMAKAALKSSDPEQIRKVARKEEQKRQKAEITLAKAQRQASERLEQKFLQKLRSKNERGSPIDAPLKSDISDRSASKTDGAYLYSKVIQQFGVEKKENQRYQRDEHTYCNIFVSDVTRAMHAEIPHAMRVNEVATWLNAQNEGWKQIDARTAQKMANEGHPAIAISQNPNLEGHGHIAMIRPGSLDNDYAGVSEHSVGDERGAASAQAGLNNHNASHIEKSAAFRVHPDRVEYWYHE